MRCFYSVLPERLANRVPCPFQIFEMQTGKNFQLVYLGPTNLTPEAAVRYELGDHHTYDFVEGNIPWETAPGKASISLGPEHGNLLSCEQRLRT